MVYRSLAVLANNKEEGLDIGMVEFQENGGKWSHQLLLSHHVDYPQEWRVRLEGITEVSALEYQFLNVGFGNFVGQEVNGFIRTNGLEYQPSFITFLGYTVFYQPGKMISQMGSGAAVAAFTGLPVIAELPSADVVKGGNGKFFSDMAKRLDVAAGEVEKDRSKKMICVALMGVLRWREEVSFRAGATGASSDSVGGCIYL